VDLLVFKPLICLLITSFILSQIDTIEVHSEGQVAIQKYIKQTISIDSIINKSYVTIDSFKSLPTTIQYYFGYNIKRNRINIAEENQPFERGCSITGKYPRHRFIKAKMSNNTYIIFYESGGKGVFKKFVVLNIDKIPTQYLFDWKIKQEKTNYHSLFTTL
jgi:hypothetical protein